MNRVITCKFYPEGTHDSERKNYPVTSDERFQPSVWYVDVIENTEYDDDGVIVYIDKYLDIIFFPEGEPELISREKKKLQSENHGGKI